MTHRRPGLHYGQLGNELSGMAHYGGGAAVVEGLGEPITHDLDDSVITHDLDASPITRE